MRIKLLVLLVILALVVGGFFKLRAPDHATSGSPSQASVSKAVGFNKSQYPTDQASSLWAVVNKGRSLPAGYVPADLKVPTIPLNESASSDNMHLRADAVSALESMAAAAKSAGAPLKLISGYRSYYTQQSLYNGYVASQGKAAADSSSAKAGHSEHQTGLAADLGGAGGQCDLDQCFGNTATGKWLAANSHTYGFVIRYQQDKQNLTGYEYEPWHVRYVGVDLANQLYSTNQTLEQFFNLPAYADYPASPQPLRL